MDKPSIPPLPSSPSCSVESQKTRLQWKSLQISVKIKRRREFCGYQGLARARQALRQGVWRLQFGWKSSSPKSLDLAPKASFGRRLPHCSAGLIKVHQEPVLVKATGGLSSSWNCWLKEGTASGYFVTTVKVLVCGTGCSEQSPMQGSHLDDSKSPD